MLRVPIGERDPAPGCYLLTPDSAVPFAAIAAEPFAGKGMGRVGIAAEVTSGQGSGWDSRHDVCRRKVSAPPTRAATVNARMIAMSALIALVHEAAAVIRCMASTA